jgi:hypothetical protein
MDQGLSSRFRIKPNVFHIFMNEKGNSRMKISNSAKYVIGVSAAVAVLAGCTSTGGSQLAPTGSSAAPGIYQTMGGNHKVDPSRVLVVPGIVKPKFHKVPNVKQMKPNCCAHVRILYVTDAFGGSSQLGAVYAFDYKSGASLGTLAQPPEGWDTVQGACGDNHGNVYFANTARSTIDEYTHGGSFVTALSDPNQYPVGCAYDKTTGNLAVDNYLSVSLGAGSLAIYNSGVLQNTYSVPGIFKVYFNAYEGNTGTLWLDGSSSSGVFQYDSFSSGTFTPWPITGGSIRFPGGVFWSAKTRSMNVGDQFTFSAPTFYQVSDTGAITGSTVTTCTQPSAMCDIVQPTVKGRGLVGPDVGLIQANQFPYPAGGSATLNYPASYVAPIGSVVSPNVP